MYTILKSIDACIIHKSNTFTHKNKTWWMFIHTCTTHAEIVNDHDDDNNFNVLLSNKKYSNIIIHILLLL